jgi:Cu/Zn superoxide dismutase
VTNAVPGARGVHVHLGSSCTPPAPGGHFNPAGTTDGMFDNITVDDAGVGHLTSTRKTITLDVQQDGGNGIVGRALAVHAAPLPPVDAGEDVDAGPAPPPPISGCGIITAQ